VQYKACATTHSLAPGRQQTEVEGDRVVIGQDGRLLNSRIALGGLAARWDLSVEARVTRQTRS